MKLAKSLLLGSAAALAATAGAYAADLPYKKAAPVEYVRVCDWTGAGYFYIPGTDSCLKIGGFARLDFQIQNNAKIFIATPAATPAAGGSFFTGRHRDITGYDARGKIEVDVRTQTAYGTLRTFVRFQSDRLSGSEAGNGAPGVAGNVSSTYMDKGYIQFAGITAGRVQSFFDMDFGADPVGFEGIATTDESAEVLAYTATFGGGLSATVSVENPNVRRDGVQNTLTPAIGTTSVGYGGDEIPDVVGNLLLVQPWGEAQLSAAYHEVNTTNTAITTLGGKTSEGYAVRAGFVVNLPMLAAGDKFELEGGYSKGAMQYTDSNGLNTGYTSYDLGGFLHPNVDAVALAVPGGAYKLALEQGYSVSGYLQHWLTPHFNDIVFGSYEHQGYGSGAGHLQWYQGGLGSASEYRIANQFNWVPVKDLQIGIEVMYAKLDQNIPGSVTLPKGVVKNPDGVQGRLRLERDF